MKAVLWSKYGGAEVLKLAEVNKPVAKDSEILVKICATTVSAGDCEVRGLKFSLLFKIMLRLFFGLVKPKNRILGQELAGEVEAIGSNVSRFKVGDKVFATTGLKFSSYAQYISLAENPTSTALAIMPNNMSFEDAAAVPIGGLEALHFLKIASIEAGDKILINGAGGSIGTIAIQIAKYYGAEVTAVDSTEKLDMLIELGADNVIDYKKDNFINQKITYDIVFDVIGKSSFVDTLNLVTDNGCYIICNAKFMQKMRARTLMFKGKRRIIMGTASHKSEDLIYLRSLIECGKIKTVIDKVYPLDDIVKAHKYVESNMKKGNLIIKIDH